MKSYHSGYDHFTPDPGECVSMQCRACDTEMDVKRNTSVPISRFGPSQSDIRDVDVFTCPHAGAIWHDQVIALKRFINRVPSQALASLIEQEIKEITQNQTPTRTSWGM